MSGSSATDTILEYDVPLKRVDVPTRPFRLNGQTFRLKLPKMSLTMGLLQLAENEAQYTAQDFGLRLANMLWNVISYIEPEPGLEPDLIPTDPNNPRSRKTANPHAGLRRGQGRILERLNDDEDALDIMDFEPIFRALIDGFFARPTGPSRGSSTTPRDGGADSLEPTSVKPAETSGTSRRTSSSPPSKTSASKAGKRV